MMTRNQRPMPFHLIDLIFYYGRAKYNEGVFEMLHERSAFNKAKRDGEATMRHIVTEIENSWYKGTLRAELNVEAVMAEVERDPVMRDIVEGKKPRSSLFEKGVCNL